MPNRCATANLPERERGVTSAEMRKPASPERPNGSACMNACVGSLQIMLDCGEQVGWFSSGEIVAELAISIAGFYLFFAHSFTTSNPFVRFEIFRDRNFATGVAFMAFLGVALFGTMALASPFMQNIIGYPVTTAG
jgi:MFS transporter, DHA2 family, multidrug resistance protein